MNEFNEKTSLSSTITSNLYLNRKNGFYGLQLKKRQEIQQQILLQHFQAEQQRLAKEHEAQMRAHLQVSSFMFAQFLNVKFKFSFSLN